MTAPVAWEVIMEVDCATFRHNPNAGLKAMWSQLKAMGYLKSFRTKRVEDARLAKIASNRRAGTDSTEETVDDAYTNRFATQYALWGASSTGSILAPYRIHSDAEQDLMMPSGLYRWVFPTHVIVKGIMPLYARLTSTRKTRPSVANALFTNTSNNAAEEEESNGKGKGKRVCIGTREVPIVVANEVANSIVSKALQQKGNVGGTVREIISIQMTGTQRHFVKFIKASRAGVFDNPMCGHAALCEWHISRMDDGSAEFEAMLKAVIIIQSCFRGWRCRAHNKVRMLYCIDAFERYRKALVSYHEWFTKSLNSLRRFMIDNTLQVIQIEARNRHRDIVAEEAKLWKGYANKGVVEWQVVESKIRNRVERDWLIDRHVSECRFEVREQLWHPYRLEGLWLFAFHKVQTKELIDRKATLVDEELGRRAIQSQIKAFIEWSDPVNIARRLKEHQQALRAAKRAERNNRRPLSLANALLL